MNEHKTTIVSIDTGDPQVADSTTAFVKMEFADDGSSVMRDIFAYSGTFSGHERAIEGFVRGADAVVIEKIDATNKFLSRSVIAEQVALASFLGKIAGIEPEELVRAGRKEVITDDLMRTVNLWDEGGAVTKHHDVREATRNLLYFMAKSAVFNRLISSYVRRFFQ